MASVETPQTADIGGQQLRKTSSKYALLPARDRPEQLVLLAVLPAAASHTSSKQQQRVMSTTGRRNSSSVATTTGGSGSAERVRRMSAAPPPPAPSSTGGGGSSTAARMASIAQAAALATAEALERKTRHTRSNSNGSVARAMASKSSAATAATATAAPSSSSKPKSRVNKPQREVVMTKTRMPRASAPAATGDVHLVIGVLGLKFKCLVQREWPCEAMVATAIAEYHLAYPACETPDFNAIYHVERKEFLKFSESIGAWCADNDEIELGMTDKPVLASPSASATAASVASGGSSSERELFDFMIMFHRLPLGFTLKQNNEHIVVANIYPHSTATHYERLETGVTVVRIADTLLENLGLRQVHDLIKNAKIPLEIQFQGHKKPSLRASLLLAAAKGPAATSQTPTRRRSGSSPKPEDDSASPPPKRTVELMKDASQRQPLQGKRSSARSRRSSQESANERELVTGGDNQNNDSPPGPGRSAAPGHVRQASSSSNSAAVEGERDNGEPKDVKLSDEDSNQNEDDTEELLVNQIKTLQAALLKKHEEAKQIARQIELSHEKLAAMRSKSSTGGKAQPQRQDHTELETGEPSIAPPARSLKRRPASTSALKLRLTPETLEAMDTKAGVPPKTAAFYQSSNVSSVSGYSNYSSRSNVAGGPRSGPRPTSVRRSESVNLRSDVSVTSHSSATSERRQNQSGPRSPRSQCVKNINNRYSYIPQKYTANATSSAEAPTSSSLSSRGAVMSRAKATRDSFIVKSESPGVGYYDVKLPTSHVRGGEIGDSDRSLPWP